MQLDDMTIQVRPRTHREAMDLGLRLVQSYWRAIYRPLLLVVLPLFLVTNLLLSQHMWLAGLIIWWLKPVYDRIVLYVLSHAVFGQTPSSRDTLRHLPGLLKTGLFVNLTLFRFAPGRSFTLPVWQLEGLRGKARRERLRILQARASGHAYWLMFICINMEIILLFSLYGLIYMFLPQDSGFEMLAPFFSDVPPYWAELASNGLYLLAVLIVEPFYVAAGFMLYLNRRTELEAWDVELGFRRLAARLKTLGSTAMLMLALSIGMIGLGSAPPVQAETNEAPIKPEAPLPVDESGRVIKEVLAHEDFATTRSMTLWLPKDFNLESDDEEFLEDEPLFPGLPILLADGLKLLLLILVVIAIIYLVINRDRLLAGIQLRAREKDKPVPTTLFGMDIQPASLPKDIAAESRRLWQNGQHRQALSLLYRGSLSRLVNDHLLELNDSMTEGDVLNCARSASLPNDLQGFLQQLTSAWQIVAYAHRQPAENNINSLLNDWPTHFEKVATE